MISYRLFIGVGRLAVGAPLAGRCYRRLARVLYIWDSTIERLYNNNLAHPFVSVR